ncbi:MAG: ribosomal RNA small subunit methyltransferase A [Phycisphaerales bacterium]|nr:ribosomal RNA small subunit methyltransferase A [Planctomycetota bacterium]MBL6997469.1 ribosomal RNA small subunit methyltransferase A [Phycisphaerales bacterium]
MRDIRALLDEYGLSPLHRLGQNFLHDHNILTKLVNASGVQEGDLVVEIGPGTGTLTEELLNRGCRVIACELDKGLTGLLQDRFGDSINLIHGDCLNRKRLNQEIVDATGDEQWRLVANLPYKIASPLLVDILVNHSRCLGQYVTIQYEVAQRLMAKVNSSEWGVLSILVQRNADVSLITKVPNTCFWPQPKIASACVQLLPKHGFEQDQNDKFSKFVTMLFAGRRKQLGSILGRNIQFPEGVSPEMRPSTLTIHQLEELCATVKT